MDATAMDATLDALRAAIDDALPNLGEPDPEQSELAGERLLALRYHLGHAHAILADPTARPARYLGQLNPDRTQARLDAVEGRLGQVLVVVEHDSDAVDEDALVALITGGVPPGTHADREDASLARALVGYERPPVGRFGVAWPVLDADELYAQCRDSIELDESRPHERAVARRAYTTADPSGATWLVELVRVVETLLYDLDVKNYVREGAGRTKRKRELEAIHHVAWLRARHAGPEDRELDDEQLAERYKWENREWDSVQDNMRRTCTRLSFLYDVLGPALLLDPTWTTGNCLQVTAAFYRLYSEFDDAVSSDEHLSALRRERAELSQITLRTLVEHMAPGQSLGEYLDHFFSRRPVSFID